MEDGFTSDPTTMASRTTSATIPCGDLRLLTGAPRGYITLLTMSTARRSSSTTSPWCSQVHVGHRDPVPMGLAEGVIRCERHPGRGRRKPGKPSRRRLAVREHVESRQPQRDRHHVQETDDPAVAARPSKTPGSRSAGPEPPRRKSRPPANPAPRRTGSRFPCAGRPAHRGNRESPAKTISQPA